MRMGLESYRDEARAALAGFLWQAATQEGHLYGALLPEKHYKKKLDGLIGSLSKAWGAVRATSLPKNGINVIDSSLTTSQTHGDSP